MTNAISENFQRKMTEAFVAMRAEEQKREEERQKLQEFLQSQLINKSINNAELDEAESERLTGALNTRKEMFEKFRKEASKTPKELFDEYRQSQVTQGKSVKNKIMRFLDSMAYYQRGGDAVAYQKSQDLYDRNRKFLNTELKEEEKTLKEIEADINKRKSTNVKMDLDAQKAEATRVSQIVAAIQRAMAMGDKAAVEKYKAELANAKVPLETQQLLAGIASKYSSDNALAFGLNSGSVPQSVMQNRSDVIMQKEAIQKMLGPQPQMVQQQPRLGKTGVDSLGQPTYNYIPQPPAQRNVPQSSDVMQQILGGINNRYGGNVPQQPQPPGQPGMPPQMPQGQPPMPQNPMVPQQRNPMAQQPMAQNRPQVPPQQTRPKVQDLGTKYLSTGPGERYLIPKAPPKIDQFGNPTIKFNTYASQQAAADARTSAEFADNLSSTLATMAEAFTTRNSKGTGSVADEVFGSLFNNPNSQNNIGTFSKTLSLIKEAIQREPNRIYRPEELQEMANRFLGTFKDGTPEKQFANRIVPSLTKSIMSYVVKQSGKQINEQEMFLYRNMFTDIVSDTSQSAFERMLNFSSKMLMVEKLKQAGYELPEISSLVNSPQFNSAMNKKINNLARKAAGTFGAIEESKRFKLDDIAPVNILGDIMEEGGFTLPGGGRIEYLTGGKSPKKSAPTTKRSKDVLRKLF